MSKSVTFGAKPTGRSGKTAEDWVMNREAESVQIEPTQAEPPEPMKRLTIDVSAALHARMKSQCALRGVKMADAVRALLASHFGEDGQHP